MNSSSSFTNNNENKANHYHHHNNAANLTTTTITSSTSDVSRIQKDDNNTTLSLQQQVKKEDWYSQSLLIVVIGASGDLAKKKTYPSLYELYINNLLPSTTIIKGFARTVYTTNNTNNNNNNDDENIQFRSHIKPHIMKHQQQQKQQQQQQDDNNNTTTDEEEELMITKFLNICYYNHGTGYDDWESIQSLLLSSTSSSTTTTTTTTKQILNTNLLIYLAVPPNIFGQVCTSIRKVLFPSSTINNNTIKTTECIISGFYRIVLEKPFGNDTESCIQLLQSLQQQNWKEQTLYRIDHYLGKDIVQSIIPYRIYNSKWLSKLWNNTTIQYVHIILKEPFGTNGRGGYFDSYGIIRDVLQNHLLQIVTLIAMNIPETTNGNTAADTIRDAKVTVLQNIHPITIDNVLLGQYNGYTNDSTIVNKTTNATPTYAAIKLSINNMPQWYNVPFIIEAGKALDEHLCEIRIQFCNNTTTSGTSTTNNHNSNHNQHITYNNTNTDNNTLVFRIQPNPTIYFTGDTTTVLPISTNLDTKTSSNTNNTTTTNTISDAYTKLILECLRGQQQNFVRDDELLLSWKIFTPLLHTIESSKNPNLAYKPIQYKQGSTGPIEREQFLYRKMGTSVNNNNNNNKNNSSKTNNRNCFVPPSIVSSL